MHRNSDAFIVSGTVVANRFTVQDTLGAGGSGIVYRAHDRVLDRVIALKLLGESASSLVDLERFEREIRLTARLVHPGIVPLFDSGWHGDRLYYVMPCINGKTLRELLGTQGRLPMHQALRLVADVAEALAYAHAMGFVHRDIKPENVFNANGRALVSDFGIARAIEGDTAPHTLTEAGIAVGTVAYMSPEQALGQRELDGRSDLYSLGCLLLELLSGEPPFRASTGIGVLAQHLSSPVDVSARLPGAPTSLVTLLKRLLEKEPSDRPSTADRIIITSGELGEWSRAMDWVERGYYVRPGRLIRVLTDLPFDRRGLASDRRYARLLRTAGLEFLL